MIPRIRFNGLCVAALGPMSEGFGSASDPAHQVEVDLRSDARYQSRLAEERSRLQDLLGRLRAAATDRAEYEPHDVTDDEAALQADAIEMRLAAVAAALVRIDTGEFGLCRSCGSGIGDERLDVLPATEMCGVCVTSDGHGASISGRGE